MTRYRAATARLPSISRLRALLAKEFLQLLRDPRMRFFVVVPPLMQLFIFGYAATFDVRAANVAVVDQARTPQTRELLHAIAATGHFTLHYFDNMATASTALDHNRIRAILRFAPDFERRRTVQLISDGSDSNSAQLVEGEIGEALRFQSARGLWLQVEPRAWYNPNLDDRVFFVPGIIANVVLTATMILMAMAVVREREFGTLERLLVTPLGRLELIIGKMAPVAMLGIFDVALVTSTAVAWFDVPFRGSVVALIAGTILFLMSTLSLGLLISTYAGTQQQAMLLAFFVIMPATIFSGFAFPIRNMPDTVQWLAWLDPLNYYLIVIRGVFLKGENFGDFFPEYAGMALLGMATLALSLGRLR